MRDLAFHRSGKPQLRCQILGEQVVLSPNRDRPRLATYVNAVPDAVQHAFVIIEMMACPL